MNHLFELLLNTPPRMLFRLAKSRLSANDRPENFADLHPCTFVLSTGRAGTKTLAQLYGLSRNIDAYHEPAPKLFGLSKLCYDLRADSLTDVDLINVLTEAFTTARRDLLNASLIASHGYAETSPQVTFSVPIILNALPHARFIHLLREPKDVVASGVRRKWYTGHVNDQWRITPKPGTPFQAIWEKMGQVEKLLWLWAETNRWVMDFGSRIKQDQFLTVRSEDLFAGDEPTIHSLYAFIDRETPQLAKIKAVLRKQINAQRSGTFDQPADWSDTIRPELATFVGKVAAELGYTFP